MKAGSILILLTLLFSGCMSQVSDVLPDGNVTEIEEDLTAPVFFSSESLREVFITDNQKVSISLILPEHNHDLLPDEPFLRMLELKKRYFNLLPISVSEFPDNTVTALTSTFYEIYAGTLRGGVFSYTYGNNIWEEIIKPIDSLFNRSVTSLVPTLDNQGLFIGTYNGLYFFERKSKELSLINNGMNDLSALSVVVYRGQPVWSTAKGNVYTFIDDQIHYVYQNSGNAVKNLEIYNEYLILARSDGTILVRLDNSIIEIIRLEEYEGQKISLKKIFIHDHFLHILTDRGLFIFDESLDLVNQLFRDRVLLDGFSTQKFIYASTHSSGIVIYDKIENSLKKWGLETGIGTLYIPAICLFRDKIVLSIPYKGILLIDEELQEKL